MAMPAERFHPLETILEEMEARKWTPSVAVKQCGLSERRFSELLLGGRVKQEDAECLGRGFGTGASLWMNLQSSYDRWQFYTRACQARGDAVQLIIDVDCWNADNPGDEIDPGRRELEAWIAQCESIMRQIQVIEDNNS